jgi:hypothetical protein
VLTSSRLPQGDRVLTVNQYSLMFDHTAAARFDMHQTWRTQRVIRTRRVSAGTAEKNLEIFL